MDRRRLGALGEREAERYLKERGAKILERNLRCPWGEIDLIARMEGFLCFIEVKSRSTAAYGAPAWGWTGPNAGAYCGRHSGICGAKAWKISGCASTWWK